MVLLIGLHATPRSIVRRRFSLASSDRFGDWISQSSVLVFNASRCPLADIQEMEIMAQKKTLRRIDFMNLINQKTVKKDYIIFSGNQHDCGIEKQLSGLKATCSPPFRRPASSMCVALLATLICEFARNSHSAEVRATHSAEVIVAFVAFDVVLFCSVGIKREVELVFPPEFKPCFAEGIVA